MIFFLPCPSQVILALAEKESMAINQFVLFLLPKTWGIDEVRIPLLFDVEGYFASENIWKEYYDGANPLSTMNSTFGTQVETFWQSEGANDYSIELTEDGEIADIRIRIDAGNYSQGELKRVLSLAHVLECNLFSPEFSKFLEPNSSALEALIILIKRSRAYKYESKSS